MSLPDFTKLGTKLSTPAWMSGTGNKIAAPCVFDNDAVRATLSGLPASNYSCLFSSDHSAGTGYIGRADFDDIEGTWTDSGAAIHSGADQREIPWVAFDSVNSRLNVWVHDDVSSGITNGSQAARLLTTTDLATLTDQGQAHQYGNHTGYGQYRWNGSSWDADTGLMGGEVYNFARWQSSDPLAFGSGQYLGCVHLNQSHILGTGNCLAGIPRFFEWGGTLYALNAFAAHPRLASYPAALTKIIAIPLDSTTRRPKGGYYTLLTPGSSGANDETLPGYYQMLDIGGTLYLVYLGQKVSDGSQHIMLAKASNGSSSQTAPIWSPRSDGSLSGGTSATNHVNWDAANDSLPASLTKTAASGSDNSNQSAGNYYELKTGSGSTQDLRLQTTSTFNPTSYETLEIAFEGLRFAVVNVTQAAIQIGFHDAYTSTVNSAFFFWLGNTISPSGVIRDYGTFRYNTGSGTATEVNAYAMPWTTRSTVETDTNIPDWTRANPFKVAVRLHDYGKRLTLLVDDHVAYHRNITSEVTWTANVFGFLRLFTASTHPQHYARFTRVTVRTLASAVLPYTSVFGDARSVMPASRLIS